MKIKELRAFIADLPDDDVVFSCFYSKDEADEYTRDFLEVKNLTEKEWQYVVKKLDEDEGVWAELTSAFRYYIEHRTVQRLGSKRKVRFNDDSK